MIRRSAKHEIHFLDGCLIILHWLNFARRYAVSITNSVEHMLVSLKKVSDNIELSSEL